MSYLTKYTITLTYYSTVHSPTWRKTKIRVVKNILLEKKVGDKILHKIKIHKKKKIRFPFKWYTLTFYIHIYSSSLILINLIMAEIVATNENESCKVYKTYIVKVFMVEK